MMKALHLATDQNDVFITLGSARTFCGVMPGNAAIPEAMQVRVTQWFEVAQSGVDLESAGEQLAQHAWAENDLDLVQPRRGRDDPQGNRLTPPTHFAYSVGMHAHSPGSAIQGHAAHAARRTRQAPT